MSVKRLTGVLHKTASGHDGYEIYEADSDFVFRIVHLIEAHFGLQAVSLPLDGIDVIYWDFAREEIKLTVGWDIWSGCFIFANSEAGDKLVREIGQYLDQLLAAEKR